MRFYRATSFIFPRHYTARIFTISFGAVHIPLITYLVLEAIRGHWDWPTFTVLLISTVIGSGFAIAGLAGLLRPVSVATRGMRALRDGTPPQDIPAGGPDMAGELLESVAHALRSTSERFDELKDMAVTDPLTGLFNRRGSPNCSNRTPRRAARSRCSTATGSSRSTTSWAMPRVTACCARSPIGSRTAHGPRMSLPAGAAMNSWCSSRTCRSTKRGGC
jgi:hypothetical protein